VNDPGFDLFEPVNVLAKFDAAWCEKVTGLAKWQERKEELEKLYAELD
jgi:hypothetical protein